MLAGYLSGLLDVGTNWTQESTLGMDLICMEETYCIEKIYSVMQSLKRLPEHFLGDQGKLLRGTDLLIESKMIN